MCNSYRMTTPVDALSRLFSFAERPNLAPQQRLWPTDAVPVVRRVAGDADRHLALLRWGLVPAWVTDAAQAKKLARQTFNARGESVREKPSFRAAFAKRRCLVLADGFYEKRQLIAMADGAAFAFAGLWEAWQAPDGAVLESCTIITTEPNALIQPIHHRMPVILDPADYEAWLDPAAGGDGALLKPCPADWLTVQPMPEGKAKTKNKATPAKQPKAARKPAKKNDGQLSLL